jgi:hypothetical protein
MILKHLYIISGSKKSPSEKDYELFDILFKIVTTYANYNGKKMFFELLNLVRLKMDFKLNGEDGFITYSLAGSLFCFSGLSFSVGQKFIDRANNYARIYGIDEVFQNGYDETLCDFLTGNWKNFKMINEKLLDLKLRKGELIYVLYQICWALYILICRGEYEYAERLIGKGEEISSTYDFDYGKLYILAMKADLELNRRNLYKAVKYYDESIILAKKISLFSWIIGLSGKKAKALLLLNEHDSAEAALDAAEKAVMEDSLAPILLGYMTAYKLFYLVRSYEIKSGNNSVQNPGLRSLRKQIEKNIRSSQRISRKVAEIKPEVDRFAGIYYKLIKKHRKALRNFQRSIEYAQHLEALPELGRTYLETAKFLLESPVNFNNIDADDCLSKAETIFLKLNLKWDLDELNRIRNASA